VKFAFEIGSNDGLFLSEIKKITKCDVLGIDPSDEPVSIARKNNIPTIKDYFSYKTGKKILKKFNKPDLIIANNVFAHIDDMNSMVKGISNMLNYGGYFMFEISYLLDIVKKYLVGTIIHEHLSYHSLFSLVPFLKKYNLNLIGFRYVSNVQGGAIVGVAKKSKKSILPYRINKMIKKEIKFGITDVKGMKRFNMKFKKKINSFKNEIFSFIGKKKIIGYGAARSAVLIIDLLKLRKKISFIIDDNPRKKNKFMPIANIPIVSFKKAYKNMSNSVLIILGWAQTERIIKFLKSLGLRLNIITIYPKFKIIKLK
jgi:2-polyprenyl-3-methyl-5-hydroxy-6-metoxy-1,4-benzoquinol methylase